MKLSVKKFTGFLIVFGILVIWELYAQMFSHTIFFTPVSTILLTFMTKIFELAFLSDIGATLLKFLAGYFVSALIMIPLGILMGRYLFLYNLFEPIVEFLRPLPSAALIPIAILFLGIDLNMKLFVICFGSSWPILINTIDGVRNIEPVYLQTGTIFGLSKKRILIEVIIPASLPGIMTGMRISLAIALILTITIEMIVGGNGLGYFILEAERSFHFAEMYAGVFTIGLLGYIVNAIFMKLDQKLLKWHHELKKLL